MEDESCTSCLCGKEGYLVGMGNPLLDISAVVDESLLQKYDMKPDDAIMADDKHMPLYKEMVDKYKAEFLAGGSVQNSLRVAQWMLKKPNVCSYFGCVGNDDYAKILKERAIHDGVNVLYQVTEEAPTGTCAVLITGTHRSLCANLAAAQKFTPDHLAKPECRKAIETAKIFYTSGFFVAVSPPAILQLATQAHDNNHTFIMNLSAPFVSQFFKADLEKLLPYCDVIFGNETEAEAFKEAFDIKANDIQEIAEQIAVMPKLNEKRPRTVVVTQGCQPVILVENGKTTLIPVNVLSKDEIVDTNGAGDAFSGGFLSQMIVDADPITCVRAGIYAATYIIQQQGCSFSGPSEFKKVVEV